MFGLGKVSEGVKEIAKQMIDNPEDWVQSDYEFINQTNRSIRIWTANGTAFIKLNGNESFSMAEKRFLVKAIKKSIANRLHLGAEDAG